MAEWTFLTNHARVLLCITRVTPAFASATYAATLGITERTAFAVVSDLTKAGYVIKERDGRRNRYEIQHHLPLAEPTSRERTIGEVLELLGGHEIGRRPTALRREPARPSLPRTAGRWFMNTSIVFHEISHLVRTMDAAHRARRTHQRAGRIVVGVAQRGRRAPRQGAGHPPRRQPGRSPSGVRRSRASSRDRKRRDGAPGRAARASRCCPAGARRRATESGPVRRAVIRRRAGPRAPGDRSTHRRTR